MSRTIRVSDNVWDVKPVSFYSVAAPPDYTREITGEGVLFTNRTNCRFFEMTPMPTDDVLESIDEKKLRQWFEDAVERECEVDS